MYLTDYGQVCTSLIAAVDLQTNNFTVRQALKVYEYLYIHIISFIARHSSTTQREAKACIHAEMLTRHRLSSGGRRAENSIDPV